MAGPSASRRGGPSTKFFQYFKKFSMNCRVESHVVGTPLPTFSGYEGGGGGTAAKIFLYFKKFSMKIENFWVTYPQILWVPTLKFCGYLPTNFGYLPPNIRAPTPNLVVQVMRESYEAGQTVYV